MIKNILIISIIIAITALGMNGYFDPFIHALSTPQFTTTIGHVRISGYEVVKAIYATAILIWLTSLTSEFGSNRIKEFRRITPSNRELLLKAFQILIYFIAFVIGLHILGIDLTALTVFGGAFGIGIGFGLQKITSNFISGLILLMEKAVEIGDLIELTDGTMGFLRHTNARYTLVETPDGREIMIPNEDFMTNRVTNWTYSNNLGRVEISVLVSYESDPEKARQLILEAALEHPRCIAEPRPACFLQSFGENGLVFQLFFWVSDVTEGRFEPKSDVLFAILKKFNAHKIDMPFPQREIHVKSLSPSSSSSLPLRKKTKKTTGTV